MILRTISTHRFGPLVLCGISIFLFGVAAKLIQQEYRIAVNPIVRGRIERTWIIIRGRHDQHVRVADLTFTVSGAGQQIACRAESLDIGDGTFAANAGDSIELSPIPGSCQRPYVINIQPPTWAMSALIGIVASVGFVFALFTWGALSDPGSRAGSSFRRFLNIGS